MKKIVLLLIFILGISHVMAITETDITKDANIKYKWYKEIIIDELYYPKKDELTDYLEDVMKREYGEFSEWKSEYCNYSEDYYLVEKKVITSYDRLDKIKYILIANASATCPSGRCTDEVKVYYNFENLSYKVLKDNYFGLLIELPDYYEPEKLLFYINTEHKQVIYLSKNKDIPPIMIASPASSENIQVVNNNWEARDEAYIHTFGNDLTIPLIKNINEEEICRVSEISTYRYKVEKEYYDDGFHVKVEDYIPDIVNYQINYTKPFPEVKEIVKNILVPKIEKEYVYSQNESEVNECADDRVIYQTKYVDKFINRVPRQVSILIIVLGLIIIFLIIKIMSKIIGRNN